MSFVPAPGGAPSFEGWTLVVACASQANVGQLAADLLVNTLPLAHAGSLACAHVLPAVGNDGVGDAPRGVLTLGVEVYAAAAPMRLVRSRLGSPSCRGCGFCRQAAV